MKNTSIDQFTMHKVKSKGNGLEVKFEVIEKTSAEVYHDEKTVKSDKTPHPDLTGILKVFRNYLAQVFYFSTFQELAYDKGFAPTEKQRAILKEKHDALCSLVTVTGVSISGKDENRAVIITGKLKTETGHEVAINSQRIKYTGTAYGFEEDLEQMVSDLETEAYEYVINGKQSQLEMAFGDEEDLAEKAEEALSE